MSSPHALRFLLPLLAVSILSGCAANGDRDGFGSPEQAQTLLALGEVAFDTEQSPHKRYESWQGALCESEERAHRALRRDLDALVTDAWARAELEHGNDLPALTSDRRSQWVEAMLGKAQLVASREPESGTVEAYKSVRVAGNLPACLARNHGRDEAGKCARAPDRSPAPGCRSRSQPADVLYYLEG